MTSTKRPLLLGHRGARRSAPENTIAAFDLALAQGCDGFEFDVRLTGDGRAVVCHDPKIKGIEVASATYAQLAEMFDGNSQLCGLEDVIGRYAGRAFLDIELKVAGLEAKAAALLRGMDKQRTVVSSFLPEVLHALGRIDAAIPLGLIADRREALATWRDIACGFVIAQCRLVNEKLVKQVHHSGKQLFAWTVNQASDIGRLAAMGVDGIVSDDTELLCRTLSGKAGVSGEDARG